MTTIAQIAQDIVAREGGFVNDPDDPGGATKFGVTIGTLRRLGRDVDSDGIVGTDDVKALTRQDAEAIFIEHYFNRPGLGLLPEALHASVFDMYVNAGKGAVRLLQELLGEFGHSVDIDGVVGPITARIAALVLDLAPDHLVDAYGIARRNYYYQLADRREASRKFARARDGGKGGWIKRAEEFISPRFHLSQAEHQARVAAWA